MDLNQKIIAGLLLAFFLITLLRIFRTPLRLALNLLNALTVGVLGLPGFVLLLLAQWVL